MKKFKIYYLIYIFCFFSTIYTGYYIYRKGIQNSKSNTQDISEIEESINSYSKYLPLPIKYKFVSAIDTRYSYPQIIDYQNKNISEKVNQFLIDEFKNLGCNSKELRNDYFWDVKMNVDYAKNDIFSVSLKGQYNCGDSNINGDYLNSVTFDMTTGDKVTFEKLFTNYNLNKKEIISLIYNDPINRGGTCSKTSNTLDNLLLVNHGYVIVDDEKSIQFRPYFDKKDDRCTLWMMIPIQELSGYFNSNSILSRIINDKSKTVVNLTPIETQVVVPTMKLESTVKEDVQIDCTGPDGKHFKTTEIECKKFNDAWSKPKIPTIKPTSSSLFVPSNNNVYIPQYVPQYNYQPNLFDQPNPVQEYEIQRKQKCLEDTIKYNTCMTEYNICMTKKINDPYAYCSNLCSKPYCSY